MERRNINVPLYFYFTLSRFRCTLAPCKRRAKNLPAITLKIILKRLHFTDKNCSTVTCRPHQKCILDKAGNPLCITCQCQLLSKFGAEDSLCGTDGRTYKRKCAMDEQSCKIGRLIEVQNYGTCKATFGEFQTM